MDLAILKTVGQISGIGGIAFGVLLLLFRDVIRRQIFSSLTKHQSFRLIVIFLVLVWSVAIVGIAAWVWVETSSSHEPYVPAVSVVDQTLEKSKLFIDDVVQVLDHTIKTDGIVLAFDITLRNPSSNPINVTEVDLRFDQELDQGKILPQAVQEVSGVYIITVNERGASSLGPSGRFDAYAWYPSTGSLHLIVKAPISQSLPPKTTDRFRVAVVFESPSRLRGPLNSLFVTVNYNGVNQSWSKSVSIRK
jgi:hypothetical protein